MKKRGRPPSGHLIRSWLTNDVEHEEPAPWVRMHIMKSPFRPPTTFDFADDESHEHFDAETKAIRQAFDKQTRKAKQKAAAKDKQFWEIVNRIENADPPKDGKPDALEEEEEPAAAVEDIRLRYLRKNRQSIKSIEPEDLELFTEPVQEIISARLEEILGLPTYQAQVYLVLEITQNEEISAIARMFKVKPQTIRVHMRRKDVAKQPVGRPALLSGTEKIILKNHIIQMFYEKNVPNIPTLIQFIADKFMKDVSSDTLLNILQQSSLAKTCKGQPIEVGRNEADLEDIADFYDELSTFFEKNLVPDSFCFNVDESGFQPWADRTPELVAIPIDADEKNVVFPVDRTRKRSSLVAAVAADGSYLAPLIIIPRKTIEKEMFACGYRPDLNHFIVSQESGFITGLIWDFWVENIFVPEVQRRRQLYNYSGEVVLMLDGCSAHSTDYFLDECLYHGITLFQIPPNSSDQVQVLDLGVFGIQKRAVKKVRPSERFSPQSKEIIKICSSWQQIATPTNITAAFCEAGLTKKQIVGDDRFYMQASIKHAQQVRGIEHEAFDYRDSKTQMKVQAF